MKNILAVSLAVLLLTVGALPTSSLIKAGPQPTEQENSEMGPQLAEQESSESVAGVAKEEPVITEEDIKSAKITPGALVLELEEPEEFVEKWQKYVYLDADQDQNTYSQTYWTRLGARRGPFDISIGWNQRFNQPATEDVDKGMLNLSMSYWW